MPGLRRIGVAGCSAIRHWGPWRARACPRRHSWVAIWLWQAQSLANASSLHLRHTHTNSSAPELDPRKLATHVYSLYHPAADGGRLWTAGLTYKGDLLELQTGIRLAAGPSDAILRRLQQFYLSVMRFLAAAGASTWP